MSITYVCIMKLRKTKKIAATANIFDGTICGDFPVNSKLITCKAYIHFVMQCLHVYII